MNVVGYSYRTSATPLAYGYVELANLTVLAGPNDSGKSRFLGNFVQDLLAAAGESASSSIGTERDIKRQVFDASATFVKLTEAEQRTAFRLALNDFGDEVGPHGRDSEQFKRYAVGPVSGGRRPVGGWTEDELDAAAPMTPTREGWLEWLRACLPEPADAWGTIVDALGESCLFARHSKSPVVERVDGERPYATALLYWCLPPEGELPADVRQAVERAQLGRHSEPDLFSGGLRQPAAPILVAPIGILPLAFLPRPIVVPSSLGLLAEEVETAMDALLDLVIGGLSEELADGSEWVLSVLDDLEVEPDWEGHRHEGHERWLEHGEHFLRIRPHAVALCEALGREADRLLPRFVADRYRLSVRLNHPADWGDHRLEILLTDRNRETRFAIEDVADGMKLWVELAIREAVDQLRRFTAELGSHSEEALIRGSEELTPAAIRDDLVRIDELFEHRRIPVATPDRPAWATRDPMSFICGPDYFDGDALDEVRELRENIYVLDEPERHLHPRLVRWAAGWLRDMVVDRRSTAVLATHSVAFLALSEGQSMAYFRSSADGFTNIVSASRDDLDKLGELAIELGLDRGELLSIYNVLLFVEGHADVELLDALLGDRLRHAGVLVIPLEGESRAVGILDAKIGSMLSSAEVALWLDNVPEEVVQRMEADRDFALVASKDTSNPVEVRRAAQVVLAGRERERPVHVMPHPGRDVFDLLNDAAIRELYPSWPGHRFAREATADSGGGWKDAYLKQYGVPVNPQTVRAIAEVMRRGSGLPESLEDLAFRLERLSVDVL